MEIENKINQIEKLKRKANLSRNTHFMLSKRLNIYNGFLNFSILVGSTIIAILTFANYDTFIPTFKYLTEDTYKLFVGTFASLIFILTVADYFLKLGERASQHEYTGKQLTTFIRQADAISSFKSEHEDDVTRLTMQYTMLNEAAPSVPSKFLIKAKKDLHERIEISKILEKYPFTNVLFLKFFMTVKQTRKIEIKEYKKKMVEDEK
ncbi:SLATT domain-containing protein [Peribacillus sp. TH27]|uniref:SLATT domain-containing protein n=1 Tax=Peribacillus sp. TH27 TaxID=2798484 RepID=UPI001911AA91|nr:SLATT domain-containing protein [Peribacillus sp. TH27]MBK5458035.1 SLATT domain-containing protein [Peribacillus sp. TH27]